MKPLRVKHVVEPDAFLVPEPNQLLAVAGLSFQ